MSSNTNIHSDKYKFGVHYMNVQAIEYVVVFFRMGKVEQTKGQYYYIGKIK